MTGESAKVTERSGASASLRSSREGGTAPAVLGGPARVFPAWVVVMAAVLLTAAVAAVDLVTGSEFSVSIFYLAPVSMVAWRLGRTAGLAWSLLAAGSWFAVDVVAGDYPGLMIESWNAAVRLGFFAIVAASLARIRGMLEQERLLAGTDHLTGVLNGRAFHELVELERSRALRYNRPFTLAYMDVDGFKRVNDELGHSRGDDALLLIATTVHENIRSMDTVARLGGDEFGLLLPETGTGAAEVALGKIQSRLSEAMAREKLDLSFSIGAVICVGPPDSVDHLIRRADALMYSAKQSGRNGIRTSVLDDQFGIEAILRRS